LIKSTYGFFPFKMEFSTDIYVNRSEPNIDTIQLRLESNDYSHIDQRLARDIDTFLSNQSTSFSRRYKVLASRIAMIMVSALDGYIDNKKCRFVKIVQIGVDHKFQRLGLCKLLLDYILKVATYNKWPYVIVECVNNRHLYKYLENNSQWNILPCSNDSFYSKCF
jgi:hypothetical protein